MSEQPLKPGAKTSEFWLSLVSVLIGVALVVVGEARESAALVELGGLILAMSGTGYALSRGIAKR